MIPLLLLATAVIKFLHAGTCYAYGDPAGAWDAGQFGVIFLLLAGAFGRLQQLAERRDRATP